MGVFDRIVSRIWSFYPKVKDAVDKVEATVEAVAEHVEQKVEAVAADIAEKTTELANTVLSTPASKRRSLEILAALHDQHLAETGEDLDYPHSVVDLLKLIGEDSSFYNRKKLAAEFGVADYKGTAEQNQQLSAIVMEKLT